MATDRPVEAAPPPPAIASEPTGPGPDARMAACGADAVWFRSLPPKVQDEYRARWAGVAARGVARTVKRRGSYKWGALRGGSVFLATHLMFGFGGFTGIGAAVLVGAALGVLWVWLECGPLVCAVASAPVYAAVWLPFLPTSKLMPILCFASLMVMSLSAAAGQMREFRQGDGEEP